MKTLGIVRSPVNVFALLTCVPVLLLLCLLLAGCNQQAPPDTGPPPVPGSRTLKIGLVPEQDVFAQKKYYAPLLARLSKDLRIPVEIQMLPGYGNMVNDFHELGLDGAFVGSFIGALAIERLGVEPLARPQYVNGTSTYYGMVFVKKGSGLRTADDMRGKRLVLVDKATTAGYLLPLAYFKSLGIADYTTWFKEYYFSGNHEDAIRDVLSGAADIGAAKNTIFDLVAKSDHRVLQELEILTVSPQVPANGLVVRRDLPDNLKRALKQQLLTMHQGERGRQILADMQIARFIETGRQDYRPVFDYAADLGLDLKSCDCLE